MVFDLCLPRILVLFTLVHFVTAEGTGQFHKKIGYQGNSIIIACPTATTRWTKGLNGETIVANDKYKFEQKWLLKISSLTRDDADSYVCYDNETLLGDFFVEVKWPVTAAVQQVVEASIGDSVELQCFHLGFPSTLWLKDGQAIYGDNLHRSVRIRDVVMLQLQNISVSDAGKYTCKLFKGQYTTSAEITLIIEEPVIITMAPPSIAGYPETKVTVTCKASGTPKPNISWSCYEQTTNVSTYEKGTTNTIMLEAEGGGNCTCFASNGKTNDTSIAHITVKDISLRSVARDGESVCLSFDVQQLPPSVYSKIQSWQFYHENDSMVNLDSSSRFTRQKMPHSMLLINQISFKDAGSYIAKAYDNKRNEVLRVTSRLDLQGRPEAPVKPIASVNKDENSLAVSWSPSLYDSDPARVVDNYEVSIFTYNPKIEKIIHHEFVTLGNTKTTFQTILPLKKSCQLHGAIVWAINSHGKSRAEVAQPNSTTKARLRSKACPANNESFLFNNLGLQFSVTVLDCLTENYENEEIGKEITDKLKHYFRKHAKIPTDKLTLLSELKRKNKTIIYRCVLSGINITEELRLIKDYASKLRRIRHIETDSCSFEINRHCNDHLFLKDMGPFCQFDDNSSTSILPSCWIIVLAMAFTKWLQRKTY